MSGFKSQSALGVPDMDPVTTSSVAVYGANFLAEVQAFGGDATILVGDLGESVYAVTRFGVNPFIANCAWAEALAKLRSSRLAAQRSPQ